MFFQSKEFRTMEAGVQLSWMQQQLHQQNIANIETPGYKAKSMSFDTVLQRASEGNEGSSTIRATVESDDTLSVQNDGNNVDLEKENIGVYKSYVQYTALLNKVKGQFDNYNIVLNSSMR